MDHQCGDNKQVSGIVALTAVLGVCWEICQFRGGSLLYSLAGLAKVLLVLGTRLTRVLTFFLNEAERGKVELEC